MSGVPNQALESMSAMALTPIMSTIGVPSQAFESKPAMALTSMVSHQEEEASANPNAASVDHLRVAQPDHLLLVIKAMVNGILVNALVDSGATRSFISDQMKTRPPLAFIGAYSSLELANGECVISTGIAPNVLISIGGAQSRILLTAVPMIKGVQIILGCDWLDMVNPLIDWKTNSLVLRCGNKLEVVTGVSSNTAQCKIRDRGLSGL